MADPQPTLAECEADVDLARAQYLARRTELENALAKLVPHSEKTAATLSDIADEFGADAATDALVAGRSEFADISSDIIENLSHEQRGLISAHLDGLLDARDVLDRATKGLNAVRVKAGRSPILYVNGRAFEIDYANAVARPVDGKDGDFRVDAPHAPQPTPTLSQQARAIEQIDHARPAVEQSRDRSR